MNMLAASSHLTSPPPTRVFGAVDNMLVLIVDDDTLLLELIRHALRRSGYSVRTASTGSQAFEAAARALPDLVLLDLDMRNTDSYALCSHFCTKLKVPVILLGAPTSDDQVVRAFAQGADDFIVKPFSVSLLFARVSAVLRRRAQTAARTTEIPTLYHFGAAVFDPLRFEVRSGQARTTLTRTEGEILRLLLCHRDRVLAPDYIFSHVWDMDNESQVSVVKTHIRRLRLKLMEVLGDPALIETVPGCGYTIHGDPGESATS